MRIRSKLAAVSAALIFGFVAQADGAQAQDLPSGGGTGDTPLYMAPDDTVLPDDAVRPPEGPPVAFAAQITDEDGTSVLVTAAVPDGDAYLEIGEYIEVELEYDDVIAALKSDTKAALALVDALGLRGPQVQTKAARAQVARTAHTGTAKLTDEEMASVASYLLGGIQERRRVTGQSDPATDRFIRVLDATTQAFDRVSNALGRNAARILRSAPQLRGRFRHSEMDSRGVLRRQTEFEFGTGPTPETVDPTTPST